MSENAVPSTSADFVQQFEDFGPALAKEVQNVQQPGLRLPTDANYAPGRGYQNPSQLTGKRAQNWQSFDAVKRAIMSQPTMPCTFLNMCPFPISGSFGVHFAHIEIPACPEGKEFEIFVLRDVIWDWQEKGEDLRTPIPIYPIEAGREFIFQSKINRHGGLVVFQGDFNQLKKIPDDVLPNFQQAKEDLGHYMSILFQQATREFSRPGGPVLANINENHRKAAAWLLRHGRISEKPKWLEVTRAEANIAEPCPACQSDTNKKGAVVCTNCTFVLDPLRAFELAMIGPDEPALKRLSREKLESLGLKHIVSREEEIGKIKTKKEPKEPKL